MWYLIISIALAAALNGLHRLCLRLEERGLLYYIHKRPSSSAAGAFVAMQQAIEPQSQYVIQVTEEKRHHSDDEAPGQCERLKRKHVTHYNV